MAYVRVKSVPEAAAAIALIFAAMGYAAMSSPNRPGRAPVEAQRPADPHPPGTTDVHHGFHPLPPEPPASSPLASPAVPALAAGAVGAAILGVGAAMAWRASRRPPDDGLDQDLRALVEAHERESRSTRDPR